MEHVTVCMLFVAVAIFEGGGCANARPAARMAGCQANLRSLYDALLTYASLHGDVPRGEDGNASLDPFGERKIQDELGIGPSVLRCPSDRSASRCSYLLNPRLSVRDLGAESSTIVAIDMFSHYGGSGRGSRMVLIGDGSTVLMELPAAEHGEWRRLFLSGDERACKVSMRDGSRAWTTSGVRWYVGGKKGYLSNEER